MGEFSPWHLLILAAVFVLLFGAKKLPDAARSMGKSLRIFKTEIKGLHDDDQAKPGQQPPAGPPQQLTAAPGPAAAPGAEQQEPASAIGDNVDGR
jgi:sec-independent protein translocase protein TatA